MRCRALGEFTLEPAILGEMRQPLTRRRSLVAVLVFVGAACATTPVGPPFEWASPPPEHRGRVYVYRVDPRNSLANVHATIDGQKIGNFRNGEYQTFEISAGSHKLRAGMRGFGFFTLGWNELTFRVRPGEVVFVHLAVQLDSGSDSPLDTPRNLEIAGQSDDRYSENIFISTRTREEAYVALQGSTRLPTDD